MRGAVEGGAGGGGSGGAAPSGGGHDSDSATEELRATLTCAVAAWLARPYVDDEAADAALAALTDDMAGF
jgi:hypothetical protein